MYMLFAERRSVWGKTVPEVLSNFLFLTKHQSLKTKFEHDFQRLAFILTC